ncbi:transporter [Bacillus sp. NTK071]|uniref:transporter n=1 Tax=Bacillus sp. NTK071 TaxID=2802175 RepID=UPI00256FD2A5|nr:transporter [Bacillus sp. NTK071]
MYYEEHEHIEYHYDVGDQSRQQPVTAPTSSPPASAPPKPQTAQSGLQAVDPGAIRGCMYRFTYIWMRGGNSFWFWPVYVGRTSVSGFRWTGRRWVYTGIGLNRIDMFTC